jgi:hypothetical protein
MKIVRVNDRSAPFETKEMKHCLAAWVRYAFRFRSERALPNLRR